MSRHRNYRNYSYEDDMSEDVYGHSVEDYDMAVSPTTAAQFMYRRTNSRDANELGHYMGCVVEEEEEEDDHLTHSQDYRRPQLDPVSEAKLSSCLDQLHSILGETCHEPTAVEAVLKYNFDLEEALDDILNGGRKKELKSVSTKPPSSKDVTKPNTNTHSQFSVDKQDQIEKSLDAEQSKCHDNHFSSLLANTLPSESKVSSHISFRDDMTLGHSSVNTEGLLPNVSPGSVSSSGLQFSHGKLLTTPLSTLSGHHTSTGQSGGLSSLSTFSTSQELDKLRLLSKPQSSLSEQSSGSPQHLSVLSSLANPHGVKETCLMLTPLSSLSQPCKGSQAGSPHHISTCSSSSLVNPHGVETGLLSTPLSSLSQPCKCSPAGSPHHISSLGSLANPHSVETGLLSTPISSLSQTCKGSLAGSPHHISSLSSLANPCGVKNTGHPSAPPRTLTQRGKDSVALRREAQSQGTQSGLFTTLSSSPAVSLADLAKSHAGTSASDSAGLPLGSIGRTQVPDAVQDAGSLSLAALSQSHTGTAKGLPAFGRLLDTPTTLILSAKEGRIQGSDIGTLSLANLAQKETLQSVELDPGSALKNRNYTSQLSPVSTLGSISLADLAQSNTSAAQSSLAVESHVSDKSLSCSKQTVNTASLSGTASLSLADLAKSYDESTQASTNLLFLSGSNQTGKSSELGSVPFAKLKQTRANTCDNTAKSMSMKGRHGEAVVSSRDSAKGSAAELDCDSKKAEQSRTDHNGNKVSGESLYEVEAVKDSRKENAEISLLSACIGSLSMTEQHRMPPGVPTSIRSSTLKTGSDKQLSSRQQMLSKKAALKDAPVRSLAAKPTMFALTISYSYKPPKCKKVEFLTQSPFPFQYGEIISAFDFTDPSPDDLVLEKQKKAFTRK